MSEPGHPKGSYRAVTRAYDGNYVDPDAYLATAARHEGSWWPEWQHWLVAHSGELVAPPEMGASEKGYAVLAAAPGAYVLTR